MCFLQTAPREVEFHQFDLLVLRVLHNHQFASAFVGQPQLGFVLAFSLPFSAVFEHSQQSIGEIFEFDVQLVFGLHRFKGAVVQTEWIAMYVLTMLRKMSSSEKRQTLMESSWESVLSLGLAAIDLNERVSSWSVSFWVSDVS